MAKITINDPKTGEPLITVEDNVSIKKLIKQIGYSDLCELLSHLTAQPKGSPRLRLVDKIKIVLSKLLVGWHTTTDVKEVYERIFKEEIELPKISSNMKRLMEKGILERRPTEDSNAYVYHVKNEEKLKESLYLLDASV
jgi:hypothetical protein